MQSLKKAINLGPRDALPKATQPKLARPVSARLATGASLPADESPSVESKEVASADSTVDEAAVRPMEREFLGFGGSRTSVFFLQIFGRFQAETLPCKLLGFSRSPERQLKHHQKRKLALEVQRKKSCLAEKGGNVI